MLRLIEAGCRKTLAVDLDAWEARQRAETATRKADLAIQKADSNVPAIAQQALVSGRANPTDLGAQALAPEALKATVAIDDRMGRRSERMIQAFPGYYLGSDITDTQAGGFDSCPTRRLELAGRKYETGWESCRGFRCIRQPEGTDPTPDLAARQDLMSGPPGRGSFAPA